MTLIHDKNQMRQAALIARKQGGDANALTAHLRSILADHRGVVVSGYWPIRGEADPRPALSEHDGDICLPVVTDKDMPLIFRLWDGTEATLETGAFNTSHPHPQQPEIEPQVLIVPLAGFDRAGNRLGYGGGYYDRTLERLRAKGPVLAIGLAWAVQELPVIPVEATDQPLDAIVTDQEIMLLGKKFRRDA